MQKISRFLRPIIELGLLALFTLFLILLFRSRPRPTGLLTQAEVTLSVAYPAADTPLPAENTLQTYPPPGEAVLPAPRLPRRVQALAEKRAALEGASAVMLEGGRLWQLPAEGPVTRLTAYNDVAVLYGWNFDGTKLLFGRGLYETEGGLANSTELWVYDLVIGEERRLVDSTKVWSAAWSPVDDRVAYCEYGETPRVNVVSVNGETLVKRNEYVFSDISWSPDGSAIAISVGGPYVEDIDGRYSVLGIWWLEKNELQLITDFNQESHYYPIWLTDGTQIIFTRIIFSSEDQEKSGLYLFDTQTQLLAPFYKNTQFVVNSMVRSPRSDTLVYWLGYEIYVMELGSSPISIGIGSFPTWHPNGKTICYLDEQGLYQIRELDLQVADQIIGGGFTATTIPLGLEILFNKDNAK